MSKSARPKGYMTWTPQDRVAAVIENVQEVLREYAHYGPMTVRQIFYRLVGQYGYPKDELAYNRLAEYLVKARRSGIVAFDRIRDDGTITHAAGAGNTRADVWRYLKGIIERPDRYLKFDRNDGQEHYIELWCEAAGMAPMLAQMVRYRDVSVYSTGGFSSVTVTYETAQRVAARSKPTYFLHVGDYDPSGESIFTSMSQDIGEFVASEIGGYIAPSTGHVQDANESDFFIPQRVALTEAQVDEFDLPTAPPKKSDSRSRNWIGETTQAEAMPPDLLESVVRARVDDLTDQDVIEELEEREERESQRLLDAVNDLSVTEIITQEALENPTLLELVDAIVGKDLSE